MEQILIRNLPDGTKAALRARALRGDGGFAGSPSVEAEVRRILAHALAADPPTLVDLLASDDGAQVCFEPERLGLTARPVEL